MWQVRTPGLFKVGGSLLVGGARGFARLQLEVVVQGGELREWRCECVVVDFFGVDGERLEEGLVEKAPLGVVGLQVGGLDVVGETECAATRDGLITVRRRHCPGPASVLLPPTAGSSSVSSSLRSA